jgi:hypothetical protein
MFFDVLIYKKPTKTEKDDGKKDELLFYSGINPVQADSQQEVGFATMTDLLINTPTLRVDLDRLEVLIRPFV